MVGRVVLLVAALLVASLGAFLVYLYAQRAISAAEEQLASVEVWVANQEVPTGTTVAEAELAGSLELVERPVEGLPTGAVTDLAELQDDVFVSTVYSGEVVIESRLGDAGQADALAVGEGQLAAAFVFDDPNRVASFVDPGSDVAVFLTRQQLAVPVAEGDDPEATTVVAGTTQLLLPSARVIAVGGPDATAEQGVDVSQALVTLSLDQEDAQRLILAQTVGELYLGLLTDTSVVDPGPVTTPDNMFGGAP